MADSYQGVGGRDRAWVLTQSAFLSYLCFCLLFSHVLLSFVLDHDSCCVCFPVYYLLSLSPVP